MTPACPAIVTLPVQVSSEAIVSAVPAPLTWTELLLTKVVVPPVKVVGTVLKSAVKLAFAGTRCV